MRLAKFVKSPEETQGFLFLRTLVWFLVVDPIGHWRHAHQNRFGAPTRVNAKLGAAVVE